MSTPRIYVACLASYNAGKLHGRWIDAIDTGEIHEEVQEMLRESPEPNAEEWAIHDYEGFPSLSEHAGFDEVAELGRLIEEHGEAFVAYAGYIGEDYATEDGFQEAYCGEYRSEQDYAEELFDESHLHEVPEHIQNYIDYEAFARDVFCGDYYSVNSESGVFVFRSL